MEQAEYDDLLRRLTALVVKIDERDTHMTERLDALQGMIEEQREFNQQQVEINAELKTLMTRVFADRHNGPDND
jgi:predicted transcriptional regulator